MYTYVRIYMIFMMYKTIQYAYVRICLNASSLFMHSMCIMESFSGFSQFHYIVYLYCETTFVKLEEPSLAHQWLLCSECGIHNADRLCQQESVTLMYVCV